MKVKFTLDGLREELSKGLNRVEILIKVEPRGERGELYTINIYAVPKLPFLQEVLGTPHIGGIIAESEVDGIYEADLWEVWRNVKNGGKAAFALDQRCKKLIERLRELAIEESFQG
ncbi:MAG: hypothetical protein J7J44_07590 [Deltaproteobacteria bacterium]|nr:hypothetical protein [Deltaproteobacteria bacterium]